MTAPCIPFSAPDGRRTEPLRTASGRRFWPFEARPVDVEIEDIAHALSQQCRFNGHTTCFYSVAQHSLHVSRLAEHEALRRFRSRRGRLPQKLNWARNIALWGLLHDASEAYLCDLPTPLKKLPIFGDLYKQAESRLMEVIAERFGLSPHLPAIVKDADSMLLHLEARDLMRGFECAALGCLPTEPIEPMDCATAERLFLQRFRVLTAAIRAENLANLAGAQ